VQGMVGLKVGTPILQDITFIEHIIPVGVGRDKDDLFFKDLFCNE
jgi:hypothetical protein